MAYAQGMGRSSILTISLLLSVDYGLRVGAYFNMAKIFLNTIICRFSFNEYSDEEDAKVEDKEQDKLC